VGYTQASLPSIKGKSGIRGLSWLLAAEMLVRMKLRVRVTPNARRSECIGWEEDPQVGRVLRVRVAAPPTEGKANAALRDFLAASLGLSKSQVLLEKGDTSRLKTFTVPDDAKLPP